MQTILEQKIQEPPRVNEFTNKSVDKFLGNHPLREKMKLTKQWVTPIGEVDINLPENMRVGLIKYIASKGYCTTMGTHKKTQTPEFEKNHYNMFDDKDSNQHIEEFEHIASELIRYYVANSWDISNAAQLKIDARAFGNMQTAGRRTYPHYHHSFDGVMIHYLTTGGEFKIKGHDGNKLTNVPSNAEIEPITGTVDQIEDHYKPENIDDMPCEGSGTMLLQDPRPSISYPYSNKAIAFEPSVGKTVFHPAYVWHESNNYEGEGIRCAVVINFRVLTRNNTDLVKPLVEA